MTLYKAILTQYGQAVTGGIGSFSQMGFTEAELMVRRWSRSGPYTVASVNAAIKAASGLQHRHAVPAMDLRLLQLAPAQ